MSRLKNSMIQYTKRRTLCVPNFTASYRKAERAVSSGASDRNQIAEPNALEPEALAFSCCQIASAWLNKDFSICRLP
jgi:hypothetical protein